MKSTTKQTLKNQLLNTLAAEDIPTMDLIYRTKVPMASLPKLDSHQATYDFLLKSWDKDKINLCEQLKVCLLNSSLRCLGICTLAQGSRHATLTPETFIIGLAILSNASSIIVAHNHPGGNAIPSKADLSTSAYLNQMCTLFDIHLKDDMIITEEGYFSFAKEGLL